MNKSSKLICVFCKKEIEPGEEKNVLDYQELLEKEKHNGIIGRIEIWTSCKKCYNKKELQH